MIPENDLVVLGFYEIFSRNHKFWKVSSPTVILDGNGLLENLEVEKV
jgi:hypothetical protein